MEDFSSEYNAPAGSWEEMALRQATCVITMPRALVQKTVRPPLPQIAPPVRRARPQPTIEDVLGDLGRNTPDFRTSFSGTSAGYSGSDRNSQWGQPY